MTKVNNAKMKQVALLYSFLFLAGLTFFLDREVQKSTYKPSFAQVPTSPVTFTEIENKLIADFPVIPIYPGTQVEESYKKVIAGKTGYEAEWITTDERQKVLNFYMNELPKNGWVLDSIPENIDSYENQIEAHKEEQKLFLTVEMSDTNSSITEIAAEFPLQ